METADALPSHLTCSSAAAAAARFSGGNGHSLTNRQLPSALLPPSLSLSLSLSSGRVNLRNNFTYDNRAGQGFPLPLMAEPTILSKRRRRKQATVAAQFSLCPQLFRGKSFGPLSPSSSSSWHCPRYGRRRRRQLLFKIAKKQVVGCSGACLAPLSFLPSPTMKGAEKL